MTTSMDNQQKTLISTSYGEQNVEPATVSFVLVLCAASHNNETPVFVTSDAADLYVKSGTNKLVAEGNATLKGLLDDFVDYGDKFCSRPVCASAKSISTDDLSPGVEIAGAPRTVDFLASGVQLLA